MSKLTEQEKTLFAGVTGRGGAASYFSPCWQLPERYKRFSAVLPKKTYFYVNPVNVRYQGEAKPLPEFTLRR
ncbi:hypothetical protein ACU636_05825 [Klebsiella aerogenes]|uniref:hypothetical protein n=1 Tax=Klebsiella aerogenes TaxID=548 RepID=UPI0005734C25|nr:hypothetical protein [Klebsiella aerogenes]EKJ9781682.1 hypothetical protein [Klebsiella aerogenes]EKU6526369.1 hypothetical protein [Klebsiella aerogenes]EKW6692874.1 hypothetical protein [Klebsiella aerogenes]ELS4603445.1 hypothetical protein [Klebsiella aerogenes]EMB5773908.1 hypothetical protein [Klebsiella aerogenes]